MVTEQAADAHVLTMGHICITKSGAPSWAAELQGES